MVVDAQAVITVLGYSVQTGVLIGVFFRLGGLGARLQGHGERIANLEQKG